jgi:hypothetical protein
MKLSLYLTENTVFIVRKVALYFEKHMEHTNKKKEFLVLNQTVRIATTVLEAVKS